MTRKKTMTPRWERVLGFIRAYVKLHGVSPSYAAMADAFGVKSRSNLHRMVLRLEQEWHLQRKPRKFYGVKLVDRSVVEVIGL